MLSKKMEWGFQFVGMAGKEKPSSCLLKTGGCKGSDTVNILVFLFNVSQVRMGIDLGARHFHDKFLWFVFGAIFVNFFTQPAQQAAEFTPGDLIVKIRDILVDLFICTEIRLPSA